MVNLPQSNSWIYNQAFYALYSLIYSTQPFENIFTMLLLKKENEFYKRHLSLQNKKLHFKKNDKFSLAMIKALSARAMNHLTIVKPETLLNWQRKFIKNFWSYKHKSPGRKSITRDIKNLPTN